ncbi:MAG: ATP-binding protein of transporter, partial [Caulobacteraceae bacterium]|nr:ATP-binding protein of transporter [Caulobacteraceae bacterium]
MRRIVPLGPQVLRLVGPHARLLPVIVLLGLVSAGLEGVGIGLIMPLLDIMMDRDAAAGHGLAGLFLRFGSQLPTPNRLALIAGAIVLLVVLKNAVAAANAVLSGWVYGKAGHAIRTGLTRRLTDIGYAFFKEQSPGRLLNVISTESWRASDALATALTMVISASVTAVLFLFLCLLSWRLTLAVAVGLALIQLVQALASGRLRSMSRGVTENNSRLASRMLHLVDGARLIRVFGQTAFERSRFDEASEAVRLRLFQLERRRVIIPPVMEALYAILFVGIIVGAWTAGVNFSLVAAFVVLLYRMQPNVRNIQSASVQLHSLSGSVEAVEWLLDPSGKPVQPSGSIAADDSLKQAIRFENVSFRFPNDADGPAVLQEASFEFRAGRSTALVGRSG